MFVVVVAQKYNEMKLLKETICERSDGTHLIPGEILNGTQGRVRQLHIDELLVVVKLVLRGQTVDGVGREAGSHLHVITTEATRLSSSFSSRRFEKDGLTRRIRKKGKTLLTSSSFTLNTTVNVSSLSSSSDRFFFLSFLFLLFSYKNIRF